MKITHVLCVFSAKIKNLNCVLSLLIKKRQDIQIIYLTNGRHFSYIYKPLRVEYQDELLQILYMLVCWQPCTYNKYFPSVGIEL